MYTYNYYLFFLARHIFPPWVVLRTFGVASKLYIFLFVCIVSSNAPQGKFFGGIVLGFIHKFKLNISRSRVAAIASRIYIVCDCFLSASAPQGKIFGVFYLIAHLDTDIFGRWCPRILPRLYWSWDGGFETWRVLTAIK